MARPLLRLSPGLRASLHSTPLSIPRRFPSSSPTVSLSFPSSSRAFSTSSPRLFASRFVIPGTPRARRRLLAVLALIPFITYYLAPPKPALNPQVYTDHAVKSAEKVGPAHVELVVPVADPERALFGRDAVVFSPYGNVARPPPREESGAKEDPEDSGGHGQETVVVQHIMVKNPDLMIERAYTPVNDVEADGEMRMVVKRVRGGEVGRLVHTRVPGDKVGLRGPVTTFAINPDDYDRIVMISTGTAVAPFVQLLAKTPRTASTQFTLLQQQPYPSEPAREDWSATYIEPMQKKWGDALDVRRIPAGAVQRADVKNAIGGTERLLVLVCLPTPLMRSLCGPLAPTLRQGPLTGLLEDMGLRPDQVWKLE